MKNVKLTNGIAVPSIGFGTWGIDSENVSNLVEYAASVGYRHVDCAHVYSNEPRIGEAFKSIFNSGLIGREQFFITSKLWNTYHRPELVEKGCQRTLKDLKLDYLDLYLMHWPCSYQPGEVPFPKDPDGNILYDSVPPESTWKAMEELVSKGLVKAIGLSNFNKSQIERILKVARVRPVMLQVESHVGFLNQDIIDFARSVGMAVTAYSPLGSAVGGDQQNLLELPVVKEISKHHSKTPAQVLLRHALQRGLIVIPRSSNPSRIDDNISIFDFKLSQDEISRLNAIPRTPRRIKPAL
ncbi:unnamed protein product [Calicophoron daubneyi]